MKEIMQVPSSINIIPDKNSNTFKYRLIIYNSRMSNLLSNKKFRAKLTKRNGEYYLSKNSKGNLITSRFKSRTLFVSIGKMINKREFSNLKNKSNTIKIKLNISPNEWGLTSLDRFLESKEERELAKRLMFYEYKVHPITYNDRDKLDRGCADLFLDWKGKKILIEITTTSPSSREVQKGINSPHGHQWVKVSGRILPLLISCLGKKSFCFFIMNKKWDEYKHVRYFIGKLERLRCFVILSSFSKDWSIEVVNKIRKVLKD